MLEYNHREYRYLEKPAGRFVPAMVRLWDDLLMLCERHGIRVLLTPFDTFWLWIRWKHHPYSRLTARKRLLIDPNAREAIKRRLAFATERWGGTGVIFGWDLWNEIHPSGAEDQAEPLYEFIEDLSTHVRNTELRVHGRSHPQTVSIFGPLGLQYPQAMRTVLTHPCLDFASTHFYEEGTIDDPRNTVDAAISTGAIMRETLAQVPPDRPFFDSESGPIHTFKDKHRTLPEPFDDEYFRHMQWAHFASGGAGGGMRWPNRRVHSLTAGMHKAQQGLIAFLPQIHWSTFQRTNWNAEVQVKSDAQVAVFACGDRQQALIWLLRRDAMDKEGRVTSDKPAQVNLTLPRMQPGNYTATLWNTAAAEVMERRLFTGTQLQQLTLGADLAIAITPDY